MNNPDSFVLTTDYATLKNSQQQLTATITVPSGQVIAGSAYYASFVDVPITASLGLSAGRISSSKNSNRSLVGNAVDMYRSGTESGFPAPYDIYAFLWRVSPNVVRFQVLIQNPYVGNLTGESGSETFTVVFNTFLPPF